MDSFPFGKESIKLSNYVSHQLNSREQEENVRILEQFRRKAVEDKFHNKHHGHLKSDHINQRYVTENMLPGVTLNPAMVEHYQPELKNYTQLYAPNIPSYQQKMYTQPVYNTI